MGLHPEFGSTQCGNGKHEHADGAKKYVVHMKN
jgi:hypothetical protein